MICNWGVLGPGFIAKHAVIPAIQSSSNGRVKAIASRDLTRAQAVATQWGIERTYDDYAALLADPTIDAVYIALPNHLHCEWTIQAARAGKHVLCEKPLACSEHEGEQMFAACQEAGVQLMEAAMYRFHPRMQYLKTMVEQGELGALRFLHSAFSFTLNDPQTYRNTPEQGGGALLDVGSYCVNAVCWLGQASLEDIQAFTYYREPGGIDMDTTALLRFAGNLFGHIQCSFNAAEHQALELVGQEGAVVVPLAFTAWHEDATLLSIQKGSIFTERHFAPADPYQHMVEHFVEALQGQTALLYPPQEALQTLHILDRLRAALLVQS